MVFVWFWHQGNISLIKWVKNYFLSIVYKKLCIIHANSSSVFDRILQWHWVWGFFFFLLKIQFLHGHHDFSFLWLLLWGEMRRSDSRAHSEVWGQTAGASRALSPCPEVGSYSWDLGSREVQGAVLSGLSTPICPSLLHLHFSTLS